MYRDKYCFGNHLKGHDAWGYFNNHTHELSTYKDANPVLTIPRKRKTIKNKTGTIIKTFFIEESNILVEEPDEQLMQKGMLNRIVYPTGGFVNFDFESNKYHDNTGVDTILRNGGGLRIRSINYHTDNPYNPSMQHYYKYGEQEEGAGQMADTPEIINNNGTVWDYRGFEYTQIMNYSQTNSSGIAYILGQDSLTIYLPASALDYTYANGAPAYYTKVTEYQIDMGVQTGKTVYKYFSRNSFFNEDYFRKQMIEGTNIPYIKVDWHLGALESVAQYQYEGGSYHLKHQKKNEYQDFQKNERPRVVYSFPKNIHQVVFSPPPPINYNEWNLYTFLSGQYSLSVGKLLLTKETEKWVEISGDTIVQTTNYYYDKLPDYMQPSKIVKTQSSGSQVINLKYPYDEVSYVYSEMKNRNIISPVIQETIIDEVTNAEISKVKVNYKKESEKIYRGDIESSVQGEPLLEELSFDLYDDNDNVQQTTYRELITNHYVWGYDGRYLVAKIENLADIPIQLQYDEIKKIGLYQSQQGSFQITHSGGNLKLTTLFNNLHLQFFLTVDFGGNSTSLTSLIDPGNGQMLYVTNAALSLPKGDYNVNYTYTTYGSIQDTCWFVIESQRPTYRYFYNSFEDNAVSGGYAPFAGNGCHQGAYTVPYKKPDNNKYMIDYRSYSFSTGKWKLIQHEFYDNLSLWGDAIDEVRIYPADAMMTTYTYQPLAGVTSETNPSGRTIIYEYDAFGRLKYVKDEDGNIIKEHRYNYAQ